MRPETKDFTFIAWISKSSEMCQAEFFSKTDVDSGPESKR